MGHGFFFDSGGDRLFGFLHPPQGGPQPIGVVFVHGAFEERQDAHLVLRDAAERLAARGFPSLRFDLFGHGDSDGEFYDASLAHWVSDTLAATDALAAHAGCSRFALVGLRLGAIIAARAAIALGSRCDRLVLWQPVLAGRNYLNELIRAHAAAEMVSRKRTGTAREAIQHAIDNGESVNLFGYQVSPAMFREVESAELGRELAQSNVPALAVDVIRQPGARGAAEIDALVARDPARLAVERVVEPQPLYTEGKYFVARADAVVASTTKFLEATR